MRVMITGGGRVGTRLAEFFIKEKNDVVVIERDEKVAQSLGEDLDALVLHGDATNRNILKNGGIEHCDALITVTGDDRTNLMVCEIAKEFKVPKIISNIVDGSNLALFSRIGITAVIDVIGLALNEVKTTLARGDGKVLSLIAGQKAELIERAVTDKSPIAGKNAGDVSKFSVVAIQRKKELVLPKPKTKIEAGDVLTICVPVNDAKEVEKFF